MPYIGAPWPTSGLSPRRRGNRVLRRSTAFLLGSIPAQAGEPAGRNERNGDLRVYPRAGGGTPAITRPTSVSGLSPRRRGNLYQLTR